MLHCSRIRQFLSSFTCGLLIAALFAGIAASQDAYEAQSHSVTNFLVVGGGGAPSYNEIALEKNVLYFQRTLRTMGYKPEKVASMFFANGNDGKATVRYLDNQGQEQFKAPQIPNLKGAATLTNLQRYFQQTVSQNPSRNLFFYFTGHGERNPQDLDNNFLLLWDEQPLNVREFTQLLDWVPSQRSIVAMMAQCFSGSFANFIYESGDPSRPVALQTRCGFFATIKTRTSVGCTPAVNEADYRDYSSSFFAGLSGRDRTGKVVASADYNKDGRVSYTEAHAFAKVDENSTDLPLSTSEAWLRRNISQQEQEALLSQPINQLVQTARPEQRYVVNSLVKMFSLDGQKSVLKNVETLSPSKVSSDEQKAYLTRLGLELINIGTEKQLRATGNQKDIATLEHLVNCEGGAWVRRDRANLKAEL